MKKRLFLLLPLFATTMTGCDFNSIRDLLPWIKDVPTDQDHDDDHDDDHGDDHGDDHDDDHGDEEPVKVSGVTLSPKTLDLKEGESSTLSYTVSPSNAANKNVEWSTTNATVASVQNGSVKAWNPGTATITVTTLDGSKKDTCEVTVTKKQSEEKTIEDKFNFNEQGYTASSINIDGQTIAISQNFNVVFNKAEGQTAPAIVSYDKEAKNEKYSARAYAKNTFTISSSSIEMTKVSMVFSTKKDNPNPITPNVGTFSETEWTGNSKSVTFTVGGDSSFRAIQQFIVSYKGQEEDDPDVVINLGEMSIAEVKTYIAEHPVKKNAFGNGVNENRYVTIKGFALAKIDLKKSTADFGLDVSEHGKVILGDNTGVIACASDTSSQGTCLWGKIGDHICKDTSKYVVTGYISEYLGHPEILVTSFAWDQSLDISWTADALSQETVSLTEFYTKAAAVNYNCAGHGYGDVVTVKDLTCYYIEADGQGKRYYNFTDGTKNIRVNAFNLGSVSEGAVYDVTGIISLKDLSPIIVAFEIKASRATPAVLDYEAVATDITIQGLKAIHGSQDDTSTRYPNVVNAYGTIYKTTGYLTAVEEGGKLYVGITDTYRDSVITGKTNAMANYNVVLIKNNNFWNTTENELYLFNPTYDEYLLENKPITVYYVVRQLEYSKKMPMWEILLLPQFVNSLVPAEA